MAIDLGKYKSVACLYPVAGGQAEVRYVTFDTSREELADLLGQIKPSARVIEAGALAGWVHHLSFSKGILCHTANLVRLSGPQVQRMQKALELMNVKLTKVLGDLTGVTGLRIIHAIGAGQR